MLKNLRHIYHSSGNLVPNIDNILCGGKFVIGKLLSAYHLITSPPEIQIFFFFFVFVFFFFFFSLSQLMLVVFIALAEVL